MRRIEIQGKLRQSGPLQSGNAFSGRSFERAGHQKGISSWNAGCGRGTYSTCIVIGQRCI